MKLVDRTRATNAIVSQYLETPQAQLPPTTMKLPAFTTLTWRSLPSRYSQIVPGPPIQMPWLSAPAGVVVDGRASFVLTVAIT